MAAIWKARNLLPLSNLKALTCQENGQKKKWNHVTLVMTPDCDRGGTAEWGKSDISNPGDTCKRVGDFLIIFITGPGLIS